MQRTISGNTSETSNSLCTESARRINSIILANCIHTTSPSGPIGRRLEVVYFNEILKIEVLKSKFNKIQLAKILRHSKPNLWSSDPPAQTSRRPAPCDAQLRRVFESLGPGLGAIALNITAGPGTEGFHLKRKVADTKSLVHARLPILFLFLFHGRFCYFFVRSCNGVFELKMNIFVDLTDIPC